MFNNFGLSKNDPLVIAFKKLVTHRNAAIDQHLTNISHEEALAAGRGELEFHKANYQSARTELESAYNLELK